VAPGCQGFSIGTAVAATWSAIGSQPVMSWRISGTPSVEDTQPVKARDQ
jgi:hypothetical protein